MAAAMRVAGDEEDKGGKAMAMVTRVAGKQTAGGGQGRGEWQGQQE